ncbi:MAG: peptidase [Frankiales bacterium]|nr:peptidase [Frankiales bacterium]
MGRHSASPPNSGPAAPVDAEQITTAAITVAPSATPTADRIATRCQERAARRQARPIWRRPVAPIVIVAVATVAIWAGDGAYHQFSGHPAAAASAADVKLDLNALASTQVQQLDGGSERVSRSSRTVETPLDADATAMPARPSLPKVEAGRTVLGTWIRPSAGGESSCFCVRWGVFHDGIDLAGPLGSPIVAVGDGVVVEAGPSEGFGHWIVIRHSNGDFSVYGHMYSVLVTVGEKVTAGQHIADIGSDGQSTGPHLHFGVMHGKFMGPYIDPVPWLKARGIDVGSYDPNA